MKSVYMMAAIVASAATMLPAAASAQLFGSGPLIDLHTNQSLLGVAIGTGRVAGQTLIAVEPASQPRVGVGVLSGKVDHFGSAASVSVANDARILGVDGPGGVHSARSLSIRNPRQGPILGGLLP